MKNPSVKRAHTQQHKSGTVGGKNLTSDAVGILYILRLAHVDRDNPKEGLSSLKRNDK